MDKLVLMNYYDETEIDNGNHNERPGPDNDIFGNDTECDTRYCAGMDFPSVMCGKNFDYSHGIANGRSSRDDVYQKTIFR